MTTAVTAGWSAFRETPTSGETLSLPMATRYDLRWALAQSDPLAHGLRSALRRVQPKLYANFRVLWNHVPATVSFYESMVYQGDLSTDGEPLPDGTEGAIPIDPQAGDKGPEGETPNDLLRAAIAEFYSAWNWKDNMTTRPRLAASLGDVLTELIDDVPRGIVYPQSVWPGHVTDIELDYVGNVKYYRLEYMVTEQDERGTTKTYRFRKEVDTREFRYFRDDQPWTDMARHGEAVQPNPYKFVPAVWDRHQKGMGARGYAACDVTFVQLINLNGMLSQGMDFLNKGQALPFFLAGAQGFAGGQSSIQTHDRPDTAEKARQQAESQDFIPLPAGATLLEPKFDIGQTLPFGEYIKDNILDLNPEASFWSELREMSQLTAPGAQRAIGDAASRIQRVRAGMDMGTVKLFQMAIAMAGFRFHQGAGGWANQTKRQQAWAPYDLDSYAKGDLDFGIKSRDIILPTPTERIALLQQQESLQTAAMMERAGLDATDVARIVKEKADAATMGAF